MIIRFGHRSFKASRPTATMPRQPQSTEMPSQADLEDSEAISGGAEGDEVMEEVEEQEEGYSTIVLFQD
jgi:hypothetical protein